jgi:hypothetical protein
MDHPTAAPEMFKSAASRVSLHTCLPLFLALELAQRDVDQVAQ